MSDTTDGGKPYCKPIYNYKPPTGPIHQGGEGPGLRGGANVGHDQQAHGHGGAIGSPGNHGVNHGNCGSQGRH